MCSICDALGQRVEADGSITITGEAAPADVILQAFFAAGAVVDFSDAPRPPGPEREWSDARSGRP
jgi:hypothetical protein